MIMPNNSIVVPAIKAQMGSTPYYQAVLRADELSKHVQAAMDFGEFKAFMESELMQRPMNEKRVEQQIIPYLCKSPDRFFGSIIVLVYESDLFDFTSWNELGEINQTVSVKEQADRSGVLTIAGGKLFALDGQHRLHALRTIVDGKTKGPRSGITIEGEFRRAVPDDELSVIFIPYETTEKARRIFNKVNRYAKPTSHSMNLLFSEDDGYAIITRCLIGVDDPDKFGGVDSRPLNLRSQDYRGEHLIEMEKMTLSTNSNKFSTINAVHEMVKLICAATRQPELDEKTTVVRPDDVVLANAYNVCARWFELLTTVFNPWRIAFEWPHRIVGARHMDEPWSLVFRPKGQEAFIAGFAEAHRKSGLSPRTLAERACRMPLMLGGDVWLGILSGTNGKMMTRNSALASRLVTYILIGDAVGPRELASLEVDYKLAKRDAGYSVRGLPRPLS